MLYRYWKHLWNEMSATGRRTFPWDLMRGAAGGAVSVLQVTFGLLIAIKVFDASAIQKSLIAGSYAGGLLLSLPYAAWSPVLARRSVQGALPAFGAAVGLFVAALADSAGIYTAAMVVFGVCVALPMPIMTAIYRENYRGSVRGQVFGLTVFITIAIGLATQFAGGGMLDIDLAYYRPFFLVLALCTLLMGFFVLRMPSENALGPVSANPLTSFGAVRENPVFGYVLLAWFLFGFANLALHPQRFEYLSQPEYGFELSSGAIVLIVGVTTEFARLCTIPIWARLFDRFNFIWLRIALCSLILAYAVLYYSTHSLVLVVLASACLGIAYGGGAITWMLWVTKFAPPEETARYMSIHTFLTGLRGVCAPFAGYLCVERLGVQWTTRIAAAMIILSIAMLWRIRNRATRA